MQPAKSTHQEGQNPMQGTDAGEAPRGRIGQHLFILKPPPQGTSRQVIQGYLRDLDRGLVVKALIAGAHQADHKGEVTLPILKEWIVKRLDACDPDWRRGVTGVVIMSQGDMRDTFRGMLHQLPVAELHPDPQFDSRWISLSCADGPCTLKVWWTPHRHMPPHDMLLYLHNPQEPVVEHAGSDFVEPMECFANKRSLEDLALKALCRYAGGDSDTDLHAKHEPLGHGTFPDFEATIRNRTWAVEVTQIADGMVSYHKLDRSLDQPTLDEAFDRTVTDAGIGKALRDAVDKKTARAAQCPHYTRFALLLVDITDTLEPERFRQPDAPGLAAFGFVGIVKLDGNLLPVKGNDDLVDRPEDFLQ